MTIKKLPSGRFNAVLKVGRVYAESRTFDTKRAAQEWLTRQRAALAGGVDPRAGRARVNALLPVWLEERSHTVSRKTFVADNAVVRLLPTSVSVMAINAVTDREVTKALVALARDGMAESSIRRFRASLSSFFAWAVRERVIQTNPVLSTRVPKARQPRIEMYPFSEQELEGFHTAAALKDQRLADLLLIAGWTGLRWSELRAIRGRDFVEVPMPMLIVQVAEPEGVDVKSTKSGKARRVPIADRILPIVRDLAANRERGDLLFVTSRGHRLHSTAVKRTLDWKVTAKGRRIHDLRHTAACLWLARGVDPVTVQAWMGHASIATTNVYLHHLGTTADEAGLDRLNRGFARRGQTGGKHRDRRRKSQR